MFSSQYYRFLAFPLFVLLTFSCQHKRQSVTQHQIDSVVEANRDLLYAAPYKADTTFMQWQKRVSDSTQWYRFELYRATAHQRAGDSLWANKTYNKVKTWSVTHHEPQLEGLVYNHLGTSALLAGYNRQACQYYERAYTLLNQPPKTNDLIAATINVADMYQQSGRLPLAAERYRYALFIADSLHDSTNRAAICCGLGLIYMELENFKEAHHFFNLAKKDIEQEALQTQYFYHFSLGNCYYFEHKYDESLNNFQQAYKIAQQLDNSLFIRICEINMGEIYLMQNKLSEAQQQLQNAKLFLQQEGNQLTPENVFYIKSLLADLDIAQHKGSQVNDFLTQLKEPHPIRSPRYLMLHYRRLMRYAAQYGQWQRAYQYQTLSDQYADSLRSRQTRNNVAELASRYQRDTTAPTNLYIGIRCPNGTSAKHHSDCYNCSRSTGSCSHAHHCMLPTLHAKSHEATNGAHDGTSHGHRAQPRVASLHLQRIRYRTSEAPTLPRVGRTRRTAHRRIAWQPPHLRQGGCEVM
mgnify:CR=1 FL=1